LVLKNLKQNNLQVLIKQIKNITLMECKLNYKHNKCKNYLSRKDVNVYESNYYKRIVKLFKHSLNIISQTLLNRLVVYCKYLKSRAMIIKRTFRCIVIILISCE